ncbi:MAG: transposase [Fimbriimonas sp.]
MPQMREKKHRLPDAAYVGQRAVSFTGCETDRRAVFASAAVVSALVPLLGEAASGEGCIVPIYCFMPDHFHILMFGLHDGSRPKVAMERFKHMAGSWAHYNPEVGIHLQRNFYDRIVRRSEGYAASVRYIALNPVRAGLAPDIESWPYTGSIGADLSETLLDAFWD